MKQSNTLPFVVVPCLLILLSIIAYCSILNRWNFERSAYLIFVFTTIYILLFERIIPLKQTWRAKKQDLGIDFKHLLFSAILFDALGKAMALSLVLYLQPFLSITEHLWDGLPFLFTFVIANLIGEFLPYWYHRVSHVGNADSWLSSFLWKIHAIHHLPKLLNWFKTSWIHPINILLNTFLKMFPLLILGFSQEIIFLVGVLHVVVAYLSHANIQTKTGFLDYLIVTPQIHHFHHSKDLEEAQNFGNILPFWDLIFGTYYNRKGAVEEVGVVESDLEYPQQESYLPQLTFPFKEKDR
ncbi:sterol desaturase family protein [Aureispira anguillae]|uniref:Sterol desaturase family protein n=1 Tax=Aureispira anguillae TaxID=2864201 RepID=A0A915YB64_9BACT|nr:sterol desaturase family protein [Aureispira anguillae]BDS09858.1 sterol desaturase family protein [Aureispira anguillae]